MDELEEWVQSAGGLWDKMCNHLAFKPSPSLTAEGVESSDSDDENEAHSPDEPNGLMDVEDLGQVVERTKRKKAKRVRFSFHHFALFYFPNFVVGRKQSEKKKSRKEEKVDTLDDNDPSDQSDDESDARLTTLEDVITDKEMLNPTLRAALTKQGYQYVCFSL